MPALCLQHRRRRSIIPHRAHRIHLLGGPRAENQFSLLGREAWVEARLEELLHAVFGDSSRVLVSLRIDIGEPLVDLEEYPG